MDRLRCIWDELREILSRRSWRRLTAIHEAGHGVAAVAHGIEFNSVAVLGDDLGMIVLVEKLLYDKPRFDPEAPGARRDAEDFAVMALAGEIAEASCSGRAPNFSQGGAMRDYAVATELAGRLFAGEADRGRFLVEMEPPDAWVRYRPGPPASDQGRRRAARPTR